jgi:hypothetical protein
VTQVLTAKEIEAAAVASDGDRRILVADGVLVTPLARDRAAALGVTLVSGNGHGTIAASARTPAPPAPMATNGDTLARLRAESVVRSVTRQVLLREGLGLGPLEEVVGAVLDRLRSSAGCGCDCRGSGRCP